MILTNINDIERYECLNANLKALVDYLKGHDLLEAELGKIVLDGDKLFINNIKVDGGSVETQPMEVHRKYVDVHILLEGKETIGITNLAKIPSFYKEYDEACDCALAQVKADCYVDMNPGDMMICFPEDGHAPAIGAGVIRKAIAKLLV